MSVVYFLDSGGADLEPFLRPSPVFVFSASICPSPSGSRAPSSLVLA